MLAINQKDSSFLILHFETTKKEKFILSCMNINGKNVLWEIKQATLNPTFKFKKDIKPNFEFDPQNGILYFL